MMIFVYLVVAGGEVRGCLRMLQCSRDIYTLVLSGAKQLLLIFKFVLIEFVRC